MSKEKEKPKPKKKDPTPKKAGDGFISVFKLQFNEKLAG
jgi:hypothetical protein